MKKYPVCILAKQERVFEFFNFVEAASEDEACARANRLWEDDLWDGAKTQSEETVPLEKLFTFIKAEYDIDSQENAYGNQELLETLYSATDHVLDNYERYDKQSLKFAKDMFNEAQMHIYQAIALIEQVDKFLDSKKSQMKEC